MTSADRRTHSLAPPHLGDVWAGAALAVLVLGVAVFIAGIGIVVAGLTTANGFDSANLPPNLAELGTWQVFGGALLFVVGLGLAAGGIALLGGSLRTRIPTAVLALVVAVAALVGGIVIILRGPSDLILSLSLFGLAAGLGLSGILLLRPRP
ncbi:MAG TPA: hypothetical protein VIA02_08730 [Candidatus Limnocylindria bacterium]|jgi:hypothetical protein